MQASMFKLIVLLGCGLLTSCSSETAVDTEPMRAVDYEHEIGVPVAAAWPVFADFGGFAEWNALPITLEIAGDGVGMTRTMDIPGIGRISERLDQRDDASMALAYSLVEGNPLGMVEYRAQVTLSAAGAESTLIRWHGEFTGGADADLDEMAENLAGSYKGMSQALGDFAAQNP
jgi:hypothetical protein